jgi:hypothetical protein
MPLFKLLPGLPSRIFSSLTAFLGGILFFLAYGLVVVMKTVQLSRLRFKVAVLAGDRCKIRGREEKMR